MKYQMFIDGALAYSSDYPVGKYIALKPKLEQAWGSATLSFTKPQDLNIDLRSVITVERDGKEIFRGRPVSSSMDFYKKTTVKCEGDLGFLSDSAQPFHEYQNVSMITLLEALLSEHNKQVEDYKKFKLGKVEITPSVSLVTNFSSTYDVLDQLTKDHSGYFRTRKESDGYYLDYLSYNGGGTSKQVVRFKENLLDFTRKKKVSGIYSIILPLGAKEHQRGTDNDAPEKRITIESVNDGRLTLQNSDLVSKYGKVTKIKTYDDIIDPQKLKEAATHDLTSQVTDITMEVKLVDMHLLDNSVPSFDVGQQVRVVSNPHGLDRYFIISKLSTDLSDPSNSKITLGRSVSSKLTDTVRANSETGQKLKNDAITRGDMVKEAKKVLNHMFNTDGEGSYIMFDVSDAGVVQQIIAMDSMDETLATKKLVFNKNGLAGSSDGGDSFSTAITTDGWIYGDRIIAGSIHAEQINASYTSAQDKKWKDELGNNYMTKVQTTTAIENSADSVTISVDSKLKNDYYTKSEIDVKDNSITSQVSQKVGKNEFGTMIRQSTTDIRVAWNGITNIIKLENAQMNVYEGASSTANKLISFNSSGMDIYNGTWKVATFNKEGIELRSGGNLMGKIGSYYMGGVSPAKRGLMFGLDTNGDFIAWGNKGFVNNPGYESKLIYVPKRFHMFDFDDTLYLGCDLNTAGHSVRGHYQSYNGRNGATADGYIYLPANTDFSRYYGPFRLEGGLIVNQ